MNSILNLRSKIVLVGVLLSIGCKKPFSQVSKTALALPLVVAQKEQAIAFITGFDKGDNKYFTNAERFFEDQGMTVINTLSSLEEIITWLNRHKERNIVFHEIHLVTHSNAWSGISLKTTRTGDRINLKSLRKAKQENRIPKLTGGVSEKTKIILHSCALGENQTLLKELKEILNSSSLNLDNSDKNTGLKLYASYYFNVFGGRFAGHYLAKPYYGFYPTGESKGPLYLAKEFHKAYPDLKIDWFKAIKTRQETTVGAPYSYTFNIPIDWEFTFEDSNDIPILNGKDDIMDFISESPEMADILYELQIPIEKYRWQSEIRDHKLFVKGKTTVLCVLAPILQDNSEYQVPTPEDRALYQIL